MQLHLSLPIYYTQTFKTKPSKTFLVGMNWYRNAHYHIKNEVKKHYHSLVPSSSIVMTPQYKLHIKLYYKNPNSDGSNIVAMMEKFTLDALQEHGITTNDTVNYHVGTTWEVVGQDKLNPRVDIEILPVP